MSKHEVIVRCWNGGHETKEPMTRRQEEKLQSNIQEGRVTCPTCHGELFVTQGVTMFRPPKLLSCTKGHVTTVSAFTNGMLHFRFGSDAESYVNIEGTPKELQELLDIKDVVCYHKEGEQTCDCALKPIDDIPLEIPHANSIKTRTRIGDLWDKAHVEPVRSGSYDEDGNYRTSRSDRANRERLKRIQKTRNIPVDNHPGKRMNKPTDTIHDRRSKDSIDF